MPNWIRSMAIDDILGVEFTDLADDALYRTLDTLYPNLAFIESALAERERSLFNLEPTILLYDVTSTYLEGEAKHKGKAKRGYSRDRRPDCTHGGYGSQEILALPCVIILFECNAVMENHQRRLGVHTSIAGGVHHSVERANRLGCSTMQIFSHNPRQWFVSGIPEEEVSQFKKLRSLHSIDPVFVHTSYLINLCAVSQDIFEKSLQLLTREMELADALNADYVILHTGSASQESGDNARKKAIKALKTIIGIGTWNSKLLLENTAGERGDISSQIKDLTEIIQGTGSNSIGGVCLDTCHAFAAGYNLLTEEGLSEFTREIEHYLGTDAVKLYFTRP
jgi:deoxyribonuclease IV